MDDDALEEDEPGDRNQRRERNGQQRDVLTRNYSKCDGEDDEDKRPLTLHRVVSNCTAFMGIIFITIGELMNEQNLWAVLLVGGTLSVVNVILTSVGLERVQAQSTTVHGSGSVVRFANTVEKGVHGDKHFETIPGFNDETRRKHKKRRKSRNGRKREPSVSRISPDAISIDLEDEGNVPVVNDRRRKDESEDEEQPRRKGEGRSIAHHERNHNGDVRKSSKRVRIRGERSRERERAASRVRERGILKRGSTTEVVERRNREQGQGIKERERRDRRDNRTKKKKKEKNERKRRYVDSRVFLQI